jgi:ribosome-binding protein aMBF1 (putative translation factor)
MAKSFDELLSRVQAGWSEEAWVVYRATVASFEAERAAREELGAQILEARKSRHLTQPQLSAATGVQQAEISRIERGLSNPTAATITRLATALGQKVVLQPVS